MKYSLLLLLLSTVVYGQDTVQFKVEGRRNSVAAQKQPYVIMISADGFRHDYAEKYQAEHLLQFGREGVRAVSMIPSFPSLTFPNHYSIVTGLYPSHHGIVANGFYDAARNEMYSMSNKPMVRDGTWYGGTPLWVLAEQQQMVSASMFWVGSEADVKGIRPSYYYYYSEKIPTGDRIKAVKDWLSLPEEQRPHFITFYVSEPDHAGHNFGPDAIETAQAVKTVDSTIYQLTEAVRTTGLPVNYIFVSDHGMTKVNGEDVLPIPAVIDTTKFLISSSSTMLALYAKDKSGIQPLYETLKKEAQHYKVYLKTNVPAEFRYSDADDKMNRIGDILLIPEWPHVFSVPKSKIGHHGFPPLQVNDMHATFMAWGPAFKQQMHIPSFENVNVYPLIAEILGLKITAPIDGRKEVLQGILK